MTQRWPNLECTLQDIARRSWCLDRAIWPQLHGRKYCTWRQSAIEEGVRGMLPVRAGDLTLTTGTWHLHFDHKTQKPASIWSGNRGDLLSSYPATSAASRNLFLRLEMPDDITLRDRACITFRRIEHHIEQCTYETALRSFSCASASSASVGAVLRGWSPCWSSALYSHQAISAMIGLVLWSARCLSSLRLL